MMKIHLVVDALRRGKADYSKATTEYVKRLHDQAAGTTISSNSA